MPGVRGGEPGNRLVDGRQFLDFPLRRLCFPGGQPLRGGGLGGAACPATVRRASALVRRVFCAACWPSSQIVRLDGGFPWIFWYWPISAFSTGVSARDRELNRSITSWLTPPTSAPLPSSRGTMA